jgi:uncharacterized protein (TIGR01370 family)
LPARLATVRTWAFAIGDGAATRDLSRYDLVVLDGEDTTATRIRRLHRQGVLVLGYLSVGTIESYRSWYAAASPYRLELWSDWGEWYADVAAPGFRSLLTDTVAPALLAKGFDGLMLDNVDMIETHPAAVDGMHRLVAALAASVHRRHGFVFAQNGEDVIGPMQPSLDGWNREDVTSTYDFATRRYRHQPPAAVRAALTALRRLRRAGLLVTATDYVAAGDTALSTRARRNACSARALPFVSDIGLRRVPRRPLRC